VSKTYDANSLKYQNRDQLLALLKKLVAIPSVTESAGEVVIAHEVYRILEEIPYFQDHPEQLLMLDVGQGRKAVAALTKSFQPTSKTAIILAHVDVVDVEEFGQYSPLAFDVDAWTATIHSGELELPSHVQFDLAHGDWLFGRGTMDMKMGLATIIKLTEQACYGEYDGNILFLAVPDEERHSEGMIGAVSILEEWKRQYDLEYILGIDTEPTFVENSAEQAAVVYSGSIGKFLLGILCIGKETHVGAPFEGLGANLMLGEISRAIELDETLTETIQGETAPPITCLMSRDLKGSYSVQIPFKAVAYYNVMYMEQSPRAILRQISFRIAGAMDALREWMTQRLQGRHPASSNLAEHVQIMEFSQLVAYAGIHHPEVIDRADRILQTLAADSDLREATTAYVAEIATACTELHPLVVTFTAPPFYPAVSSTADPVVRCAISDVSLMAQTEYGISIEEKRFFPGLSDLSYLGVSPDAAEAGVVENMPLWQKGYDIPFQSLRALKIPVLNLGPFGKDAHKWTERLELHSALDVTPRLLQAALQGIFR
jgi:arginine utilization protein RocB